MGNHNRHPAYRGPWQTIRKQILTRDNHTCQIRGRRCTTTATHVDHIIPITAGGPWWDPDNLRASCPNCNIDRVDRTKQETWRTSNTRITLIIGPPGINKTTAITAQPGDLIIDYDTINAALGIEAHPDLHGPALKARGAILGELKAGRVKSKQAFIISSNPKAEGMFPHHTIKLVDPGIDQALRIIGTAGDIKGQELGKAERLVREWYRVREGGTRQVSTNSRKW
jgi:hypothetical protein